MSARRRTQTGTAHPERPRPELQGRLCERVTQSPRASAPRPREGRVDTSTLPGAERPLTRLPMQGPPGARVLPSCAHSTSGSFPEALYVRGPRPRFPTTRWDLFSELRLGSGERAPSRAVPGRDALALGISSGCWNAA